MKFSPILKKYFNDSLNHFFYNVYSEHQLNEICYESNLKKSVNELKLNVNKELSSSIVGFWMFHKCTHDFCCRCLPKRIYIVSANSNISV